MAKKKEKKAGKRMKKSEMSERLISLFHTKPNETFSLKQLSSSLNLTTHPLKMLCADIITEMIEDDFLQEVEKGHYKLNDHGLIMTGVFQRKSNGKNSFIPDDGGETIFIAERNSAHAMNNDKVKIALFAKRKNRNGTLSDSPKLIGDRDSGTCQRYFCRHTESREILRLSADREPHSGK